MKKLLRSVKINHGKGGWGGPLVITPNDEKKYILSVTTGGIHPVAKKIGELSGAEVVDQFKHPIENDQACCVVIDCAGIARCGTYPKLGIPTININLGTPSGPLAKYIKEDIFVSGVTIDDIIAVDPAEMIDKNQNASAQLPEEEQSITKKARKKYNATKKDDNGMMNMVSKIGTGVGRIINIIYQSARDTVDNLIKNIIPFMLFVSVLIGIINYTGFGELMSNLLAPLAGHLWGLVLMGLLCSIPFLSPLICPGAIVAAVMSILLGQEIAKGSIPPNYALPALYAVNCQVGSDFAPVGLTLMEAKPKTIEHGVPAFLIGKLITGPLAIIIAFLASFGL